ncbi:MAG: hypothetical protein IK077_15395 [Thermoguttaceae bacterium]|nr:hypothetical protein [Thermoguttaceae bacterium]
MSVNNAYKLCIALLKQDASGSVYPALTDPEYASVKWNLTSIIPVGYDFTNYNQGNTQIETVEKNTITVLSKARKYESGTITPPQLNFNSMTPADVDSVISVLDALTTIDDPFKVLFLAGNYKETNTGVRTYDVFNACAGIVIQDGERTAEAKAPFTGTLSIQACHLPLIGKTKCGNATLSWTESTGVIAATFSSGSGSGAGSP